MMLVDVNITLTGYGNIYTGKVKRISSKMSNREEYLHIGHLCLIILE